MRSHSIESRGVGGPSNPPPLVFVQPFFKVSRVNTNCIPFYQVMFGLGSGFVDCLSFFIFLRFAAGASCTGLMLSAYVYFMEIVGPSKRTFVGKFQDLFWAASGLSIALLGYLVRDWRLTLIIASIPGVFFFLFWR